MMDKKKFTALYQKHFVLVRRVIGRRGVKGADLDEVSQEVWADIWKQRDAWPAPEPTNPGAYLAEIAKRKANMHLRTCFALKRAGVHLSLDEDRTSTANMQLSRAPEAERLVEQTSLGSFLRRLAERMGGEKKQLMLDHLESKRPPLIEERPSAVRRGFKRMIASCRTHLGLPKFNPKAAGVDPLTHLAGVVRSFATDIAVGVDEGAAAGGRDPELSDAE